MHVRIRPISFPKPPHAYPSPALHLGWESPLLPHHLPLQLQERKLPTGSSLTGSGSVPQSKPAGMDGEEKVSVVTGEQAYPAFCPPHMQPSRWHIQHSIVYQKRTSRAHTHWTKCPRSVYCDFHDTMSCPQTELWAVCAQLNMLCGHCI